jgi:hypothetical protein
MAESGNVDVGVENHPKKRCGEHVIRESYGQRRVPLYVHGTAVVAAGVGRKGRLRSSQAAEV